MRELRGKVTVGNEAVVEVEFQPSGQIIEFLLDTGFNGSLCVPRNILEKLNLKVEEETFFDGIGGHSEAIDIAFAEINWFDIFSDVSVLVNDGEDFLLGTQLLTNKELYINYKTGEVLITENE